MLNLLPNEEKINIRKRYIARFVLVSSTMFFLVVFMAIFFLFPIYYLSDAKHQAVLNRAEIIKSEEISTGSDKFKEVINLLNNKISILNTNNNDSVTPHEVIRIITRHTSEKLKIKGIFYDKIEDGSILITLRGVSDDRESLFSFVKTLEGEDKLSANLPVSNLVKGQDIDFSIQVTVSN